MWNLSALLKDRVFRSKVLEKMFSPLRDEVANDRRNLRSEEIHDLYSSVEL
jgi:hypothetical protein